MISERDVFSMMEGFGVPRTAKVTIRASIKSIGGIEGGADGLIDALKNYLSDGLLLVPTHTWATVTPANPVYDVRRTPPCIGTLADAAAFRRDGFRSLHPTHSMTGFGREAESYLAGEENAKTPTPVGGALSRLVEEDGYVLLTIGFCIGLGSNVAELGANPLALLHRELVAALLELLTVEAVGKVELGVANRQAQVDVFVDARLIVSLIDGCGLQAGNDIFRLGLALVGGFTGHLYELELLSHAADDECRIVETHHDEATKLAVGLRCEAQFRGDGKLVGRSFLE